MNFTYLKNTTCNVYNNTDMVLYAYLTDYMENLVTGQTISFYVNKSLIGTLNPIECYANLTFTIFGEYSDLFFFNAYYNGIGTFDIIIK